MVDGKGDKDQFVFSGECQLFDSELKAPITLKVNLKYLPQVVAACPDGQLLLRVDTPLTALGVASGPLFAAIMPHS